MKISKERAIKIAENKLTEFDDSNLKCVLIIDDTIEKDEYFVFFYNSDRYLETQEIGYALVGNAPLIIDKYEGSIYITGTAHDIDYYLSIYEKEILPQLRR